MAGKTWEPSRKGARELNRAIRKGMTVYTVSNIATNLAPYEDSKLYSAHTFDRQSRITGEWMTGHLSVSGLLAQSGTVYEQPPVGMRNVATPGPQYGAPLGDNYSAPLDEDELRGLEKQVAQHSNPRVRRDTRNWRP